ncbi:MAG: carbon-nitrogen hydrolase family protein [Gammaproteobacteria bacterium]|nr:carbon-nitrogen hydrolase family protein [Gammaproteobacteria bacterium]
MTKIAAIQMASGTNVSANLIEVSRQILSAAQAGAKLIVLPENFAIMGLQDTDQVKIAENDGIGPIQDFLSEQAKKNKVWLIAGTIPLKADDEDKIYAASLVYNDNGERVSRYDKIHLFDVHLEATSETYKESETIAAGNQAIVVDTPFGKIGLAICYDLRFPELFRQLALQDAEIIVLPAAFTAITGKAHWEVLIRARAIENLCYLVASAQGGYHVNGRETHGDSMIVDPWGSILDHLPQGSGYVIAEVELENVKSIRKNFPALQHRKISCPLPTE